MKISSARTLVPCQSDTGEFFAEDTEVNAVNLNPSLCRRRGPCECSVGGLCRAPKRGSLVDTALSPWEAMSPTCLDAAPTFTGTYRHRDTVRRAGRFCL